MGNWIAGQTGKPGITEAEQQPSAKRQKVAKFLEFEKDEDIARKALKLVGESQAFKELSAFPALVHWLVLARVWLSVEFRARRRLTGGSWSSRSTWAPRFR